MNILYVTPSFYPAVRFGGPIIAGLGLCRGLVDTGAVKLKVHTTDAAGQQPGQKINANQVSKVKRQFDVEYCRRIAGHSISIEFVLALKKRIHWAHLVHLSAVFSFPTLPTLFLANKLGKPVVWSPHGALQQWQGTSKQSLKKCWIRLCMASMDPKRCCLHLTSEKEKTESQKVFADTCHEVIPNGVDVPEFVRARPSLRNRAIQLMFIGRVHPIKGLENLLKAMAEIRDRNCELRICGTGADGYLEKIKNLCSAMGLGERVRFLGHVNGREKYEAFMNADVCVVPSHKESFGIVVAEALAHGVPVIASTGTPWAAIEHFHCGIWTSNEPTALAKAIETMGTVDLSAMGANGRLWMQSEFSWKKISRDMLSLYTGIAEAVNR